MSACDFFPVDCAVTLRRINVVFDLQVASRSVHLLGATTNPDGWWTTQQVRNLVMDLGDRVTQFRFLVRDRADQFAASFDPSSPRWASAWSEFLLAARGRTVSPNGSSEPSEPNSPTAWWSSAAPARSARGVRSHYNGRRPHRARDLRPPRPTHPVADLSHQRIKRRPVLRLDQRVQTNSVKPLHAIGGRLLEPHRCCRSLSASRVEVRTTTVWISSGAGARDDRAGVTLVCLSGQEQERNRSGEWSSDYLDYAQLGTPPPAAEPGPSCGSSTVVRAGGPGLSRS
jgi:putative transposase